jgi:S-layer family protein
VVVDAYEFEGTDASITTGWVPFVNRRYRTGGNNTLLIAGLDVPNGAQITKVAITGCDQDPNATLDGSLVECSVSGEPCTVPATAVSSPGAPGCSTFTTTLPTPRTVNHSTTSYTVIVNFPIVGPSLQLRRMAVYYKLQVSPAPATATFSDVPVGHPLHRFVEALAAAGITGGCGGSEFCPNATLTRGQMAVFLSTALGLHWPN